MKKALDFITASDPWDEGLLPVHWLRARAAETNATDIETETIA